MYCILYFILLPLDLDSMGGVIPHDMPWNGTEQEVLHSTSAIRSVSEFEWVYSLTTAQSNSRSAAQNLEICVL